jgi:hypothetical protein
MSQLLLEKTVTMLYNPCESAPFYIQIDKYNKDIGLLSFVDKNTNLIMPIPENIEVFSMKEKKMTHPVAQDSEKAIMKHEDVLGIKYEQENKIEKVANKPCFKIVSQKHYVVLWDNRKIFEMKPLYGWSIH